MIHINRIQGLFYTIRVFGIFISLVHRRNAWIGRNRTANRQ